MKEKDSFENKAPIIENHINEQMAGGAQLNKKPPSCVIITVNRIPVAYSMQYINQTNVCPSVI